MKRNERGVIVDAMTICCEVVNDCYVDKLYRLKSGEFLDVDEYRLFRVQGRYYDYTFNIIIDDGNERYLFGHIKFGINHSIVDCNVFDNGRRKVWLSVDNRQLYTSNYRRILNDVICRLGLSFHNVTTLDLSYDITAFNVGRKIKSLIRDKTLVVILNGKVCRDRDVDRPEISFTTSGTLNKDKYITVNIKQKKAIKDKSAGVTICCYDKRAEIRNSSSKKYILDFYGNPNKLYRTEVHLNNEQLKKYMSDCGTRFDFSMMTNAMLEDMFFYFLNSVIRFRRGRRPILWDDVLRRKQFAAEGNNNPPCQNNKNRHKKEKIK